MQFSRVLQWGKPIVEVFRWLYRKHLKWYYGDLWAQRRVAEEDVRRLGGTVTWHDDGGLPP